jgi:hypothetical protein
MVYFNLFLMFLLDIKKHPAIVLVLDLIENN